MRARKKPSLTADAVCAARAYAADHPDPRLRNPDSLAARIVGMPFRVYLWPGLRRLFFLELERRAPGAFFFQQARTKRFDEILLDEIRGGAEQLVLLGAGFDTRAYRFAERMRHIRVFELDHPLTSAEKQRRLRRIFGELPHHVTYVPVDFAREAIGARLASSGYVEAKRTFFLWEGVSAYLTRSAVDATLRLVGGAARGSSIAFDYLHESALLHPTADLRKQLEVAAAAGEPYDFAVDPSGLTPLLGRHGLTLVSDAGPSELAPYVVGTDGRAWGKLPPFLSVAHARVGS